MNKNLVYVNHVKEMISRNSKEEYSHVIICYDKIYDLYFPRYVSYFESIKEVIQQTIDLSDERRIYILEIYNYNLDIGTQLEESRAINILPNVKKHIKEEKFNLALEYATKMHNGQKRKDGTPYIMHPIRVANNVKKFKDSRKLEQLMMCGYLHDTVEDTDATIYDIDKIFGEEIASIVNEVTNDNVKKEQLGKEKYLSIKMRDMTSWALVVKLCDRLDNVSDLARAGEIFRIRYINETLGILSYILYEREFSYSHLKIIKEILNKLEEVSNLFGYNDERLDKLKEDVDNLLLKKSENVKQLIFTQTLCI